MAVRHSRFLLSSLIQTFLLPWVSVYLLLRVLQITPSIVRLLLGFSVAVPLNQVASSTFAGHNRKQLRGSLRAIPVPRVKGKLPGNIDILWQLVYGESTEYCAETLRRWAEKYGPTYDMNILWSHQIVTSDPSNVKHILATHFQSYEKSAKFHDMLEGFLGDSVFTTDGNDWKFHRAMARPFFAHERTSDLDAIGVHLDKVVQIIHDKASQNQPLDFQDLMSRFTMDSISSFLYGISLGTLDAQSTQYSQFVAAFNALQKISMIRIRIGSIWPMFEIFGDKSVGPARVIDEYVNPIIQKAMASKVPVEDPKSNGTFLDYLVQETEDPKLIRDSLVSMLLAGRDTTTSLLTFSLYALTLYPDVFQTLKDEVHRAIGSKASPTMTDIRSMKYLRAILNETLRLFPPVPMNIRRSIGPTALPSLLSNLGDPLFINAGNSITYAPLLMHRRQDIWGPNAEEFKPSRWLDEDDHKRKVHVEDPFAFLPFNAGPRICLGQFFAYQQASLLLIRLVQQFDTFSFATDAQPIASRPPADWAHKEGRQSIEKVWVKSSLTLYAEGGLWLRFGSKEI